MNLHNTFDAGLPYHQFLEKHGTVNDRERWKAVHARVALSAAQFATLAKFRRETHVLVLAGAWCGDCVGQCPIFEHFVAASPGTLKIHYADRDVHADSQAELKVNGGNRVPVVVFFSEDGQEVSRFGDRTLSRYRELVEKQTGESCGSGIVGANDPVFNKVIQEWLGEFERVQWILRLSPRLRQKHGD